MHQQIFRIIGDDTFLQNALVDMPTIVLFLVIGVCVVLLSKGADWMIDGVVQLACRTGLSRIVIAATVISLGTTTPEAFVSVMAAWMGNPGLALGNGVGSIIADTGLVFGLTCVLTPVPANRFILNRTGWVQVGSATLLVFISVGAIFTANGEPTLQRWVGVLFLVFLVGYLYVAYIWAKQEGSLCVQAENIEDTALVALGKCWGLIIVGLSLILFGARVLVPSASGIAHRIGVPEDIIACTLVAFGTSLPELMTAIASVRKGHPEIMVGNVVGADVLNCLFVIGAAATSSPLAIPANFYVFHFPTLLIILYSFRVFIYMTEDGKSFKRWQGVWLLGIYLIYIGAQYYMNIGAG